MMSPSLCSWLGSAMAIRVLQMSSLHGDEEKLYTCVSLKRRNCSIYVCMRLIFIL